MAPRSTTSTASRSPPSTNPHLSHHHQHKRRSSDYAAESEFGTPASLPKRNFHGNFLPPPPPLPVPPLHRANSIPTSLLRTIATSADESLTSIDFSNRRLDNDTLYPLLKALESNTTIETLNLSKCQLDNEQCQHLGELLGKNHHLEILHLDHNNIGVEGTAALSTGLITNTCLKTLTLSSNPIGDRGLLYLLKACNHNTILSTLELANCGITQKSREEQLQSLLLNRRIDSNFESLLERLRDDDYRVTGIDLSGRPLGDEGITRLSEVLADNTQVRQLWLRDCAISNVGANKLGSCLEQNMSIVDLFLGGNEVGDEGLRGISVALGGSNSTLVSLEMDDNRVTDGGVREFLEALKMNTSVLVATFENNQVENGDLLVEMQDFLEERRRGMNLVSFVVDPEEEDESGHDEGLVNMSVCSSYMPSTYRRAGFRSVASTKHSRSIWSNNRFRHSTTSQAPSVGSHVYSIYNKSVVPKTQSPFYGEPPQDPPHHISAASAAMHHYQPQASSPPPPPFRSPQPHQDPSPNTMSTSPPETFMSSGSDRHISNSDRTGSKKSSSRSHPPPPPPREAPLQPQGTMGQPQHNVMVRRLSSGSGRSTGSGRRSRRSSRTHDPPGNGAVPSHLMTPLTQESEERGDRALAPLISNAHQSLVKVGSVSHKSSSKSSKAVSSANGGKENEVELSHHIAAMRIIQEEDAETQMSFSSGRNTETAEHYDKSLTSVARKIEMMRLMNYLTSIHYRSRHFWFWFTPISSCIFLAGVLSLASAIDMGEMTTLILSLTCAFFALVSFVLNFFQTKFGWSSLAQTHRRTTVELAKVGKQLEQLRKYEGGQLTSRSVSSRTRANAVRDLYRMDVYLTAMEKCTPKIPKSIDQSFRWLVSKMEHFGKKYPNAIKARLKDYEDEVYDPNDPIPLVMQLDAFDLLCLNIRKYSGFPLFLPDPQKMVSNTTTVFFSRQGLAQSLRRRRSSASSYDSRSGGMSRRSSTSSYGSRSYSSHGSYDSRDSYDSRSRTRTTRSSDMYTDDLYTEDSRIV